MQQEIAISGKFQYDMMDGSQVEDATSLDDNAAPISSILTAAEVAAASDNHTHCLVCYSDLTVRGKTPCEHDDICGVCHLRLRFLHGDKKCPICKQENKRLIVDSDPTKKFDEYPMWGDEIGADFVHRDDVGMFFQTIYYEQEILPLFGYACQKCDYTAEEEAQTNSKTHGTLRLLQDHLRTEHRLTLCNLCVENKRDFVALLPRFTPSQLQKHLRQGDGPTSGFFGHPICEFCKPKRFYDLAYLHQHLRTEHYKCHVCEKQGLDNQFFNNYKSLERHFDRQHFMCHDVQCLAARFVVFHNELDLRAHEISVHGGTSTGSTKINLEFRTRRPGYDGSGREEEQTPPSESDFNYGLDGQAFVPQALPNSAGGGSGTMSRANAVQLHPLHMQRTEEFRSQAAAFRQQQSMTSQEESFPSLQSATGQTSAPLVGWASGNTMNRLHRSSKPAGKVTQEDFPSLGPAPSANANATKKATKGNLGATRRQFAAMTTSGVKSAGGDWAANPALASSAQTNNFLTPAPPVSSQNSQANLAPDNFPTLGPSANARPTYKAAHNLAKKTQQQHRPAAPALNSTEDFPTVAAANKQPAAGGKANSVRDRVLGNIDSKLPSQQENVLQASVLSSAKATVEEIKASLGPNKFKQLKRLTKDFAETSLSPEGYVDQSAALFDRGYADPEFWSFLPSLLESCPNPQSSERALHYMASLKRQQFAEKSAPPTMARASAPTNGTWGGNGHAMSNVARPPPTTSYGTNRPGSHLNMPGALARPAGPSVVAAKKKNAWGGTGAATVVRAKAPPGSVAMAAANQVPQAGSATKFMAKEAKQQAAAKQNVNGGSKPKKKKQKDELRALAFGGK